MFNLFSSNQLIELAKKSLSNENVLDSIKYVQNISEEDASQYSDFLALVYWRASCVEALRQNYAVAEQFTKKAMHFSTGELFKNLCQIKISVLQKPLKIPVPILKNQLDQISRLPNITPLSLDQSMLRPELDKIDAPFCYRSMYDDASDRISQKIREMKKTSHNISYLGAILGMHLCERVAWAYHIDLIIPTPLHPSKLKQRGYNQSEEIAKEISSYAGIPVFTNAVKRIKDTQEFRRLSRSMRAKEIIGAFEVVDDQYIKGRNILIVDDVITYGSTLRELAKTLHGSGAEKVYGLALCKTEKTFVTEQKIFEYQEKEKEMFEKKIYYAWLRDIPSIGPLRARTLIHNFASPSDIFSASTKSLEKTKGLNKNVIEAIRKYQTQDFLEKAQKNLEVNMTLAKDRGVRIIFCDSPGYPQNFSREQHEGPIFFYAKGDITCLNKQNIISLVGTRKPSPRGLCLCREIAKEFSKRGWIVASGLAKGIDGQSHLGALDGDSPTVAVLGNGLEKIYPAEHKELSEKIVQKGCLISQYDFGTKPEPDNLKKRNRTMGALSRAIIVVEAPIESGAFNAVRYAHEKKLPVFTFPPSDNQRGSGNIKLIACAQALNLNVDYYNIAAENIAAEIIRMIEEYEKGKIGIKPITKDEEYWKSTQDIILKHIDNLFSEISQERNRKKSSKKFLKNFQIIQKAIKYDFMNKYIPEFFSRLIDELNNKYLTASDELRTNYLTKIYNLSKIVQTDRRERLCIEHYEKKMCNI